MTPVPTINLDNLRRSYERAKDVSENDPQAWTRMVELRAMVGKLLDAQDDVAEIPVIDLSKPASEQGL